MTSPISWCHGEDSTVKRFFLSIWADVIDFGELDSKDDCKTLLLSPFSG